MNKKLATLFFALVLRVASAYELQPWFYELLEFSFTPSYTFEHYSDVQGSTNPSKYVSNDHIVDFLLQVSPFPTLDVQIEATFEKTRRYEFGFETAGLQLRYLFLNDVAGDPVSLAVGLQSDFVDFSRLKDVSVPYHFVSNFELGSAVGKEFDKEQYWVHRLWAYAGVGIANRGEPWIRARLAYFFNLRDRHRFHLFSEGYFGTGGKNQINIGEHTGYFNVAHRSIDIGAAYQYHFDIWGDITLEYFYRPYAHAFPKNLQSITLSYRLPFSIF